MSASHAFALSLVLGSFSAFIEFTRSDEPAVPADSAAPADEPIAPPAAPQERAENQDTPKPAARGLRIDIGRFTPAGRGIVIEVGREGEGKRGGVQVDVDVRRDGEKAVNVDVDVNRDADAAVAERGETALENYLGVFTAPVPEAVAAQLADRIAAGEGLQITHVVPDSPAAEAGLKRHDVLVAFGKETLRSTDQLAKLIRQSRSGERATVEIIRAGKSQTIEVAIGQREVKAPAARKAEDDSARIEIRADGIKVPGVEIQWSKEAREPEPGPAVRRRSVSVTTEDGKVFEVIIDKEDRDPDEKETRLKGSEAEIRRQIEALPETIRGDVERGLDRAIRREKPDGEPRPRGSFHFRLQPRVDAEGRGLHISMSRTGDAGRVRVFELDQQFRADEPVRGEDLLEIDVFARELKELTPEVRARVEATIRRVRIPEVRVDVQNSL